MTAPLRLRGVGRGPSRSPRSGRRGRHLPPADDCRGSARPHPLRRAAPRGRRLCLMRRSGPCPSPRSPRRQPIRRAASPAGTTSPFCPASLPKASGSTEHYGVALVPQVPAPGVPSSTRPRSRFIPRGHQAALSNMGQHWSRKQVPAPRTLGSRQHLTCRQVPFPRALGSIEQYQTTLRSLPGQYPPASGSPRR